MRSLKIHILLLLGAMLFPTALFSQNGYSVTHQIVGTDTVMLIKLDPIIVFGKRKVPRFYADQVRLMNAIRVCYPIAQEAQYLLQEMVAATAKMKNEKQKKEYIDQIETSLKKKYIPILKRMNMYQGAVLLKLLDRQTGATGYQLLKEIKGGLSAFFWQAIARLYGANLKAEYAPRGRDWVMELLVLQYEQERGIPPRPNPGK